MCSSISSKNNIASLTRSTSNDKVKKLNVLLNLVVTLDTTACSEWKEDVMLLRVLQVEER